MDDDQLAERVHALQVSLKDGDDLARAIGLIGDALQRRMTSIRANLEDLKEDGAVADGERLEELVQRVGATLDRYEEQIHDRHQRIEAIVHEFQDSLGTRAEELGEFESQLAGHTSQQPSQEAPAEE